MSHWTAWDWIAYGCLGIAAFGLAFGAIWRENPAMFSGWPDFWKNSMWSFVPMALFALGTVVLIVRLFFVSAPSDLPSSKFEFHDTPPHIVVSKKTFVNERVMLDGRAYRNCTFENVTFVFNGTEPFELTGNTINGRIQLASDNPSISGTFAMMRGLGLLGNVDFRNDSEIGRASCRERV